MKNIILAAALVLVASVSQAAFPTFSLKCTSPEGSTLQIVEWAKGHGREIGNDPVGVTGSLSVNGNLSQFKGAILNIGIAHTYSMSPAANGEPVSLQVALKVKFARNCGRCPQPIDPIEPEEPTPTTYFAKLTVGDQVHNFVCQ
jgi:hypothetical protein